MFSVHIILNTGRAASMGVTGIDVMSDDNGQAITLERHVDGGDVLRRQLVGAW